MVIKNTGRVRIYKNNVQECTRIYTAVVAVVDVVEVNGRFSFS